MAKTSLRNDEVERELSPWEQSGTSRREYQIEFGYRYRDGVMVDVDDYRYPEILEGFR